MLQHWEEAYKGLARTEQEKAWAEELETLIDDVKEEGNEFIEVFEKRNEDFNIYTALSFEVDEILMNKLEPHAQEIVAANVEEAHHRIAVTDRIVIILVVAGVAAAVVLGFLISRSITTPLKKCVAFAEEISQGNLTETVEVDTRDETGVLADALNKMTENLRDMVVQVQDAASQVGNSSDELASNANELAATSNQLSEGAQNQASTLEETSAAVEELSASVEQVAGHAQSQTATVEQSTSAMTQMKTSVDEVSNTMSSVVESIKAISDSSAQIAGIINVISDIADQTNLLALNASIEAARAGEHGRGFAFVADEVSKLADRSGASTKEIETLIKESEKNVAEGGRMIESLSTAIAQSVSAINESTKGLENINEMSQSISAATEEQITNSKQVSKAIESVNGLTQQAASASEELSASAEEMSASTEQLSGMAQQLQGLVSQFKVTQQEDVKSLISSSLKDGTGVKLDNITKLLKGLADQQKTGAKVDEKVLEKIKTEITSAVNAPVLPEEEEVTDITLKDEPAA